MEKVTAIVIGGGATGVGILRDLAMRGVGSKSCGPDLPSYYEIPKTFKNTFKFTF